MDEDVWTHPALCWNGSQFAVNADVPEGSDLARLSPAYLKRECPIAADPLQLISEHERACAGLVRASRLAEPARWENMSDAEVSSRLDAPQIIAQLERHRERIVSIHRKMHLGAVRHQRVAPSDPGLSIARVETYKKELEAAHQEHLQWFKLQPEAATAGQEAEAAEGGDQQAEPPPYRRSGSSSPSRRSSGKSVRWWDERD